jgi:hypothetical protein
LIGEPAQASTITANAVVGEVVPHLGDQHARVGLDPGDEEDTDLLTLDATPLIYALLSAVKELTARVEALEAPGRQMMGRRIVLGGAAAVISSVFGLVAWAAGNPAVGSIWTYLGPTLGADWVPNPNIGAATCTSIEAFGGKGDDIFDNTNAFNTAKASANCLVFPAGTFRFNSAITYGFPSANSSLRILGQGQDVTVLHFSNAVGNALTITQLNTNNSVHIRGLAMTTDTNKVDTAIFMTTTYSPSSLTGVNNALSDFNDLAFHGSEGYKGTYQWARGISTLNVGSINFIGINAFGAGTGGWATSAQGDGIIIAGNSSMMAPVQFNFIGCNFITLNNGIVLGANVQGVTIAQSNFTGVNNGVSTPAGVDGYSQLNVTSSQFNALTGINLQSPYPGANISNNMFIVDGSLTSPVAINLANPGNAYSIISNNIITQGSTGGGVGININANASDAIGGTITGNTITAKAIGIALDAGAQKYVVANNAFYANTQDVVSDVGANIIDVPLDCTGSAFGIYFGGSPAGITYNARSCSYFQIGREVTVAAKINLSSKGTATGNATLSGLPVTSTSANEQGAAVIAQYSNFVSTPGLGGYVGQGSGSLAFQVLNGSTGTTQATNANFTNNSTVILRITYRAP